jgi:carboxyl-terminal processing protease
MRAALTWLSLLGCLAYVHAVPLPDADPPVKPVVPPISQDEARNYAHQVFQVASIIADKYVRPISRERLIGEALRGLHEAAGVPLPAELQGDPEKELAGRDLIAELTHIRQMLGNPEAIRGDNGVRVSILAMIRILDPFTTYLSPDERRRTANFDGTQFGVGLTFDERQPDGTLIIQSVTLGSPAHHARLRPGDRVVAIDGQSVEGMRAAQATTDLNGEQGPQVKEFVLTVRPQGASEERSVKLVRTSFREETVLGARRRDNGGWDYMLDPKQKIGLIRVTGLVGERNVPSSWGTWSDVRHALRELKDQGLRELKDQGLRGLILDLRDCPGGYLEEAIKLADLFLAEGIIASVNYPRDEIKSQSCPSSRGEDFLDFPMVVLIGPETSGGGELIAAALQDNKRAKVAGQRSRGKASVQQTPTLGIAGSHQIKLTVGYFARPSGKNLSRFVEARSDDWGVQPDAELEVRLSPPLLARLAAWRQLHALRPHDSTEALPLDDLRNDPVQLTAIQYLQKVMR